MTRERYTHRAAPRSGLVVQAQSSEKLFGLDFIDDKDVEPIEELARSFGLWARIQDHYRAGVVASFDQCIDRCRHRFQRGQNDGRLHAFYGLPRLIGADGEGRARNVRDTILARLLLDDDQGDTRGLGGVLGDRARINPVCI